MRIVVADQMMARYSDTLESQVAGDVTWQYCDGDNTELLMGLLPHADIFVGSHFSREMAQAAHSVSFIQAIGAGIDGVDLDALGPDIVVANVYNHGRSIAEFVLMSMIALSRRLLECDALLRRGVWNSALFDPGAPVPRTLRDQTVGLVGFGHIGVEVAALAHYLDMQVVAVKREPRRDVALRHKLAFLGGPSELPHMLSMSDFVAVLVPLSDSTRGLIGSDELARMKSTAFLINVARGAVVDEAALFNALRTKRIAGAALDVWYAYPHDGRAQTPAEHPFHELSNVILTPHNSGVTEETFQRRAHEISVNIDRFLNGAAPDNVVRPSSDAAWPT